MSNRNRKFHARSKGFSLIELMLALALGLVVVTGIVQLFVGNSQTYAVLEGQSRLQENARFAFDFISRSAQTAGFWGCAPERANVVKGLVADEIWVCKDIDTGGCRVPVFFGRWHVGAA